MTAIVIACVAWVFAIATALAPHIEPYCSYRGLICQRFVATLKGNEGEFAGVLTKARRKVLIFEQCSTVPKNLHEGTATPIPGRVICERATIAYLQELPANDTG